MIALAVFLAGIVLLAALAAASMRHRNTKSLKEWERDRGALSCLMAQNLVLVIAIFAAIAAKLILLDVALLGLQLTLYFFTLLLSLRSELFWPIPVGVMIVGLHLIVFL